MERDREVERGKRETERWRHKIRERERRQTENVMKLTLKSLPSPLTRQKYEHPPS